MIYKLRSTIAKATQRNLVSGKGLGLRQEYNQKFEASLDYTVRSCLTTKKKTDYVPLYVMPMGEGKHKNFQVTENRPSKLAMSAAFINNLLSAFYNVFFLGTLRMTTEWMLGPATLLSNGPVFSMAKCRCTIPVKNCETLQYVSRDIYRMRLISRMLFLKSWGNAKNAFIPFILLFFCCCYVLVLETELHSVALAGL